MNSTVHLTPLALDAGPVTQDQLRKVRWRRQAFGGLRFSRPQLGQRMPTA